MENKPAKLEWAGITFNCMCTCTLCQISGRFKGTRKKKQNLRIPTNKKFSLTLNRQSTDNSKREEKTKKKSSTNFLEISNHHRGLLHRYYSINSDTHQAQATASIYR